MGRALPAAAPAPLENASGTTPKIKASEVIKIGRKRKRAASNAAATANVSGTNINTATINGSLMVYARVSYRDCVLIFPVTFSLTSTPKIKSEVTAVVKNICDNNADFYGMLN